MPSADAPLPVLSPIMSGKDARRTKVVMEKTILTEFLRMYQSFPCLWDQKHMLYGNREARDNAYEALLEKYKLVHENATIIDVKKKIEYMRCAYRREHKKVLMTQFRGGEYKPHLWYFDLLTFLNDNEQHDFKLSESLTTSFEDSYQETHEVEDSDDDQVPKQKRRKKSSNNINISSNPIYVEEENHNDNDIVAIQELFEHEQDQPPSYIISNEADAFGRTVGFQLKGLNSMQRIFAEKLISDVIFHARLGNLNTETRLSYTRDD